MLSFIWAVSFHWHTRYVNNDVNNKLQIVKMKNNQKNTKSYLLNNYIKRNINLT